MLSTIIPIASLLALAQAGYETYPSVAKTASINGFADKLYGNLPACAQQCVKQSTSSTPCPYWDAGCLCVMSNFGSAVANCIAQNCQGADVGSAESLATSVCSSAGVPSPYWYIDSGASSALGAAEAKTVAATTTATSSAAATQTTSAAAAAATSSATTASSTQNAATTSATTSVTTPITTSSQPTTTAATSSAAAVSTVQTSAVSISAAPSVSSAYNAAAGVAPAAAAGLVAGVAMLL
ncbi:hypothetical protein JCM33374_g3141 [Metschnikowia sp. JCM 33374]|nr:hypothetical protein JCM33374_g3141 [Metschnikowia sp. JCM 33374]